MNTPLIAANWKMHKTRPDVRRFFAEFQPNPAVSTIIAASPALLAELVSAAPAEVTLAAQNIHAEEEGAFTGETSAAQVSEIGCHYVMIGHSERRHVFHETQAEITKKVQLAFACDLTPIYCVGETLEQRQAGETETAILAQLQAVTKHYDPAVLEHLVVAYEPVWAIGTGQTPTVTDIAAAHNVLRAQLPAQTTLLYGGSVKPENAAELYTPENVNGFLVGGASLDPASFSAIIDAVAR